MKEVEIRWTQVKMCFPEWSGSTPDFFREWRINATKEINFFSCVQDLFNEKLFPQYGGFRWGSIKINGFNVEAEYQYFVLEQTNP
jgi:hypothetical protein